MWDEMCNNVRVCAAIHCDVKGTYFVHIKVEKSDNLGLFCNANPIWTQTFSIGLKLILNLTASVLYSMSSCLADNLLIRKVQLDFQNTAGWGKFHFFDSWHDEMFAVHFALGRKSTLRVSGKFMLWVKDCWRLLTSTRPESWDIV